MPTTLITTWAEYDSAVQEILALATHRLCIFDKDLALLKLERPERLSLLRRFLGAGPERTVHIALQDAGPLLRNCPRLMELLAIHAHNLKIIECPTHLAELSDALLIADAQHAVVRFHKDHARAKTIINAIEECAPYQQRHDQILAEGGTPVTATTLGL